MLNLGKRGYLFGKKIYPYATGGDYVYLYEEDGKTYRVHEFLTTATSTLEVEVGGQMDILVVGGGGGGSRTSTEGVGGGGGGAVATHTRTIPNGTYSITVGSGGLGAATTTSKGSNGGQSRFYRQDYVDLKASGGGGGGPGCCSNRPLIDGATGGAGGGAGTQVTTAGIGGAAGENLNTEGEWHAYPGGNGGGNRAGAGGGGAGGTGQSVISNNTGDGGIGYQWYNGKYYAGGGGGAGNSYFGTKKYGIGGLGGGGDGSTAGENGEPNTGGGGGGVFPNANVSASGGSGIVIVRYVVAEKKLWTPSELGSSVAAWYDGDISSYYDATSGGNLVQTNGTVVKRWEDVSGNAYHVSSSTTSTTLATNFLNGKNVLKGDGIASNSALTLADVPLGRNVANLSVVSVFKVNVSGSNRGPYGLYVDGSGKKRANCYTDDNVFKYNSIRLDSDTQARTSVDTGFFPTTVSTISSGWVISLTTSRFSQQSFRCYINGTIRRNDTVTGWTGNSSDTNSDRITVLGADYESQATYPSLNGEMAEMLVIHDDVAFDDDLRTKLEGYLAHKWGLTNNLPSGHPYKYEPPYKVEPEEIVTDGLVLNLDAGDYASYPRSGTTWYDISGSGLTGALTNGPTYDSTNKGSIVFDGSDDYCTIPYNASLNPTTELTVSVWAYKSNWGSDLGHKNIISCTEAGGWQISQDHPSFYSGEIGFLLYVGGNYRDVSFSLSSMTNGWNLLSVTFDGRYLKLYVNGTSVDTYDHGSSSTITYGSSIRTVVGAEPSTGTTISGQYWSGKISSVNIYNRALSSTEIQQNFNALRGRYGI